MGILNLLPNCNANKVNTSTKKLKISMTALKGFTLFELLITVVIIGILSSVAVPAYTQVITTGKFAGAPGMLTYLYSSLEQAYAENRSFANAGYDSGSRYCSCSYISHH